MFVAVSYSELSQKTRVQSVPIAALRLYYIQRENLVLKKSLCSKTILSVARTSIPEVTNLRI